MTKEYRAYRRKHGIAEWERNCRFARFQHRLMRAYKVPGTPEAGQHEMKMQSARDTAKANGWKLYEEASK